MSQDQKTRQELPLEPEPDSSGLSLELRLLIAFALTTLVLFLSTYLFSPPGPQTEKPSARPEVASTEPSEAKPPPESEVAAVQAQAPPPLIIPESDIQAEAEQQFSLETEVFRIVFTNRGATVKSWLLKNYLDLNGEPLELVNTAGVEKLGIFPFAYHFEQQQPPLKLNDALFKCQLSDDKLAFSCEFASQGLYARKSWSFEPSSYVVKIESRVLLNGQPIAHQLAWRGGFGDPSAPNYTAIQRVVYFDRDELIRLKHGDVEDGPQSFAGTFRYGGIEDNYFALVALPPRSAILNLTAFADPVPNPSSEKEEPHLGVALGLRDQQTLPVFIGPKQLDLLAKIDPALRELVDFGWFSFLAHPLFIILKWLHDSYIHNYGWAIIILTIVINFALLPLKISSMRSMRKMQELQPLVQAINEKYKGMSIRDPRRAQQNQEIMELYKKHGVNPLGGCMPILLQIPFFFAFYKVLSVAIELRGASWLWVKDLSRPEDLPIRILPITMVISQFLMQRMTPSTSPDPMQRRMLMLMPLFLGFIFYNISSGLVLYWLTSNLVAIAQQWFINKTSPPLKIETTASTKPSSKKKKGRRGK